MTENTKTTTDPMAPPSPEQHVAMDALLDKIGVGDPEEPAPRAKEAPEPEEPGEVEDVDTDEDTEDAPETEDAPAAEAQGDAEDTTEEYDRAFDALVRDYGASAVAKLEKKLGREDLILMGLKRAKEREKLDAKFHERSKPKDDPEDEEALEAQVEEAGPPGPSPEEIAATKELSEALALDAVGTKYLESFARAAAVRAQADTLRALKPKLAELEMLQGKVLPQVIGALAEIRFEQALKGAGATDLSQKERETLWNSYDGMLERPPKAVRELRGQARADAMVRLALKEEGLASEKERDERLDRAKKNGTPPKASRSAKVAKPLTFQDGVERRLDLILEDGLTDAREVNRRVRSGRPT